MRGWTEWLARCPWTWAKAERQFSARVAADVAERAGVFTGLYEPLYGVAHGDTEGAESVLGEWCLRAANLNESGELTESFVDMEKRLVGADELRRLCMANALLRGVTRSGIRRDVAKKIVYAKAEYKRYGRLIPPKPAEGTEYEVQTPCWSYRGEVLDKGILR